jgi:hypothetical protein
MLDPDMALEIMLSANHVVALIALEQLDGVACSHVAPQLSSTSCQHQWTSLTNILTL